MSFWALIQIFLDFVLVAALGFVWVRLNRPAKDDPRLSRGLQLLQSKISVLEDLSDRTETQVTQLTAILEQKCRDIQNYVGQAEKQIQKIEQSMGKSLEVAKIFQDKIPHQEIIERQNTLKYVKAARMAHQGASVDDIASQVDLSRGEIEFIAKVNRDQLQFSEADLPDWVNEDDSTAGADVAADQFVAHPIMPVGEPVQPSMPVTMTVPMKKNPVLSQLGDQFRQALNQDLPMVEDKPKVQVIHPEPAIEKPQVQVFQPPPVKAPAVTQNQNAKANSAVVKKVIFPRVEGNYI